MRFSVLCSLLLVQAFAAEPIQEQVDKRGCVDFIFEMGMLSHIERAGIPFLGSGDQTIAEHAFKAATIGYVLSTLTDLPHDPFKLVAMCLFHDVHETHTGDLNYVQKGYLSINLEKVW